MSALLGGIKRYSLAFVAPSLVRHVDSQFSFSSILSFGVAHTVFYPLFFIRFTLCLFTSNFSFVDFHRHRFPLSRSLSLPLHPFFSHLLRLIHTNIVDSFSCGFFRPTYDLCVYALACIFAIECAAVILTCNFSFFILLFVLCSKRKFFAVYMYGSKRARTNGESAMSTNERLRKKCVHQLLLYCIVVGGVVAISSNNNFDAIPNLIPVLDVAIVDVGG